MSVLRYSVPGQRPVLIPDVDPYNGLSQRQRFILDVVRSYNGNRSRASRQLGITVQSIQSALRLCERAGAPVPPAMIGRRGRPDLRPRSPR